MPGDHESDELEQAYYELESKYQSAKRQLDCLRDALRTIIDHPGPSAQSSYMEWKTMLAWMRAVAITALESKP